MQHYYVQVSKSFDIFPFLKCYQFFKPKFIFYSEFYRTYLPSIWLYITLLHYSKMFHMQVLFHHKNYNFLEYAFIHSSNIYKVITTCWHINLSVLYSLLSHIYLHEELIKCWSRSVWSSPSSLSIFCFFSCNTLILLKSWTFSSGKCSETDGFLLWEISLVNERLSACLLLSGTAGGLLKKRRRRKIKAIQGCILILKMHKYSL